MGVKNITKCSRRRKSELVRIRVSENKNQGGLKLFEKTIGQLFDLYCEVFDEDEVLVFNETRMNYKELHTTVNKLANSFLELGITKGKRIAVYVPNCQEYIFADLALAKIGAIKVPLNERLHSNEVTYMLNDSGATALIVESNLWKRIQNSANQFNTVEEIIFVNEVEHELESHQYYFDELINQGSPKDISVHVEPDDVSSIFYTGGTTGKPKGVMHTHRTQITIAYSLCFELDLWQGVRLAHFMPLPHATGLIILAVLMKGGSNIVVEKFTPDSFLSLIEEEQIEATFLPPTAIGMVLDVPNKDEYNLDSLKLLLYGAAPMPLDRLERALEFFGPKMAQAYAQMECANQLAIFSVKEHVKAKEKYPHRLLSSGRPITIAEVKICDHNGNELPKGEFGEIVMRAPHVMKGYWNKPEETSKAIKNGWLYTGDIGYLDDDNFLYLVDRKKDMIISGGLNIYPREIEEVLFKHPDIKDAAVIGVPDEKWGESVKALIVKEENSTITLEEIDQYCRNELTAYKVPKSFEWIDEIPLTTYGKPDKKVLKEKYWKDVQRNIN